MLTHWKKLHNPDYIGAYAFEPGQEMTAVIKSAGVEDVVGTNGKKEPCMVVRFQGDMKPLICNVTNSKAITKALGTPYIEEWAGKAIQLYTATVNAFGEEVEAVRVRTKAPKMSKDELTPDHPKWAGAVESLANNSITIDGIKKHFTVSDANAEKLASAAAELIETGEVDA